MGVRSRIRHAVITAPESGVVEVSSEAEYDCAIDVVRERFRFDLRVRIPCVVSPTVDVGVEEAIVEANAALASARDPGTFVFDGRRISNKYLLEYRRRDGARVTGMAAETMDQVLTRLRVAFGGNPRVRLDRRGNRPVLCIAWRATRQVKFSEVGE